MSKFISGDEATLASMVNAIAQRLNPVTDPSKIAKIATSKIGLAAMAVEGGPASKKLAAVDPALLILTIVPPDIQQGFMRDQLRALVIALAEHPVLFDQDELAQILEGRRSLRS